MSNLSVNFAGIDFKNPVTVASGTFGDGLLMNRIYDVSRLGGIFAKGTTYEPREGNAPQRMAETFGGMINAVGLQNKGVHHFIEEIYPKWRQIGTHLIMNVNGNEVSDYVKVAEMADELEHIPAIEVNISCPNVKHGGMLFGVNPAMASEVVREVRKVYHKPIIVKLTPNVTDITLVAKAVEDAGADAVSLVNTFLAMAVNAKTRKPVLSTVTGGLSGPCIKPIALRMVWQVFNAVHIPIVGLGGIRNAEDAIEFMLCGASLVQVGTYNFVDPLAPLKIIEGIDRYLDENKIEDVSSLIGALEV